MKFTQLVSTVLFFFLMAANSVAQNNIKTYDLKKGEVLDILLIRNQPEGAPLFDRYKKTAFPVALELSYQPLPGFKISEYTQGNHHPHSFLLSKWDNLAKRERFLATIDKKVPDFHEQRRAIWSTFDLTYYEMQDDVSFQVDKDKVIVATAYWQEDTVQFTQFKKAFLKKAKKAKGRTVIELTNGISPFGYYYQPDYLVITEWDNRAEFDAFYQENVKMDHDGVKHVNQFLLN